MSSKIFKNNQVTYGVPFQVRIPITLQNANKQEEGQGIFVAPEEQESSLKPEAILERANEEAALIIKEAEYEARKIIDDSYTEAREKAAVMEEEAWQKGYADGIAAAQAQCEETIAQAEEIKNEALMKHDEVLAGLESEIINLVLSISKKVIGTDVAINKENMLYLIKHAIDSCSNKNGIKVRLAPEDCDFVNENRDRLAELLDCAEEIELKQDPTLKQGACILETPFGSMDAGMHTKLKKIEEAFREMLGDNADKLTEIS